MSNELSPTGVNAAAGPTIGAVFANQATNPTDLTTFTNNLATASNAFFGNGTAGNTGTLGNAIQTSITPPFTTYFGNGMGALNSLVSGTTGTLNTALANRFGTSFANGAPIFAPVGNSTVNLFGNTTTTALPSQVTNGATATRVFNAFTTALNNLNSQFNTQLNALNSLNTNFVNNIQGQINAGLQAANTQFMNGQTVDLTDLANSLTPQFTAQQGVINNQLQSINQNLNTQFTNLVNTFGGFGAPFQQAINNEFATFNSNLNTLGATLNNTVSMTNPTGLGTFVTSALDTTGTLGSVSTNPANATNPAAFNTATSTFFGPATTTGSLANAANTGFSTPFTTTFVGGTPRSSRPSRAASTR